MKRETKVRIISALAVAPFVVACFVSYESLVGLVAAIVVLSSYELLYFSLKDRRSRVYVAYLTALTALFPVLYGLFFYDFPHVVLIALFLIGAISTLLKAKTPEDAYDEYFAFFAALLYVSLGLSFFLPLYKDFGVGIALLALTGVWAYDSFAYFVGLRYGKVKIFQKYTTKSLEGVMGGFVGTFVYSLVFNLVLRILSIRYLGIVSSLIFAVIVSVMDTFGDVFESSLKRRAGVKDSGVIMPGHGGMLDRIDGLLFSTPVVYIVLSLLGG